MMDAFARKRPSSSRTQAAQTGDSDAPAKRVKHEIADTDDDDDQRLTDDDATVSRSDGLKSLRPAIESSLPEIKSDDEAIEEYHKLKASQGHSHGDAASRSEKRGWVKGQSSLYVDAFNLALSTVLEDESHLFDEKERNLFHQWENLNYEAQYLYVRLFLRKSATWHRIGRLGYYNDIADTQGAIEELQKTRRLPPATSSSRADAESSAGKFAREEHTLGESFHFADDSGESITTVEEALSLLNLDELKVLAKEAKVLGKNKADLVKSICKISHQQAGLLSLGFRRTNSSSADSSGTTTPGDESPRAEPDVDASRQKHFLDKIMTMAGPSIRLSMPVFKLFERVHLVFYRSTEWTEKSLTTIILAKISRRNFPPYILSRSADLFSSREHLLEFETATRTEFAVDSILDFNGRVGEEGFRKVLDIFDDIYPRWQLLLKEEQRKEDRVYESGEGAYLRRFSPVHPYTRIIHKGAYVHGRLKNYKEEHSLMTELLHQRLFHPARRGGWYQRKALLEEHYMFALEPDSTELNSEARKKRWKRVAVATCETALEDRDCHLKYHYDLQKRLTKLERQLKIPHRLQHDFGHVQLKKPEEHVIKGVQIKKDDIVGKRGRAASTKTIWVDEAEGCGECSVEAMCLSWYRSQGWKGYHAEGGIVRTLFAYLFFDILFTYAPNVFQTAYQTCPLDLFTDSFYATRASEINHRLVEIANGGAARLVEEVDTRERERRTCVVGLNWDYELSDLVELVSCFDGAALAAICKVMSQEYGQRGGGMPDLILWRTEPAEEVMFSEVKSANDRLSDTQRLWIHVLTAAGIRVALANAVANEVREG